MRVHPLAGTLVGVLASLAAFYMALPHVPNGQGGFQATAQRQGGPPNGGPPGFSGGPPGFPGGPPPGFGGPGDPLPISLAGIPLHELQASLRLSPAQARKVFAIQQQYRNRKQSLMPRPIGGSPNRAQMRVAQQKIGHLDTNAGTKIKAALTPSQRKAVPGLLRDLNILRAAGIPMPLYRELRLSPTQKSQLAAIGATNPRPSPNREPLSADWQIMQRSRRQLRQKVLVVLNRSQRRVLQTFESRQAGPGFPAGPGFGPPPVD